MMSGTWSNCQKSKSRWQQVGVQVQAASGCSSAKSTLMVSRTTQVMAQGFSQDIGLDYDETFCP